MPLENGTLLGPYRITGVLGRGGMGEVYRAHDPRLRLQSIADMRLLLDHPATAPVDGSKARITRLRPVVATIALLAAVTLGVVHVREAPPGNAVFRLSVTLLPASN